MTTLRDPRHTSAAVAAWLGDALRPPDRLDEALSLFNYPGELLISVTWGGDEPGCSTLRIGAGVREDGTVELFAEHSDEAPPDMRRRAMKAL